MSLCSHCGKSHGYNSRACRMANPTLTPPKLTEHQREAANRALRPHATALRTASRPTPKANRASEKQVNYVLALLDRVIANIPTLREGAVFMRETVQAAATDGTLTKNKASEMIEKMNGELAKVPKVESPPPAKYEAPKLIHLGMYYYDGKAYRAKESRSQSGRFYVEELVLQDGEKPQFVYARGVVNRITPEHKMSAEQAAMFSRSVGACTNCFRELTANESLRRMYGPICAARNGWPYDTNAD